METIDTASKIKILRHMIEVVMWEWNAVKEGRWEELPTHCAKKQTLIEEMSRYDWTPLPPDRENTELLIIESQIIDLEYQVKKMLESRMTVLSTQISSLKQRHSTWKKVVSPYRNALAN
jgi:hypothetical protein